MAYWPFDNPSPYDDLYQEFGAKHGVDPVLLRLMARRESAFNPGAVSPKGAQGLFQVMPETAKGMGFDPANLHDPRVSTDAGAKYLRQMMDMHDGDVRLALAGYNAGPGAVKKYGGVPPYKETQDYVSMADEYEKLARQSPLAQSMAAVRERGTPELMESIQRAKSQRQPEAMPAASKGSVMDSIQRVKSQPVPDSPYDIQAPKGSKEWAEGIASMGGQVAIKPTQHNVGSAVPGSTFPAHSPDGGGPFDPFDSTYPTQYKARVERVVDADTVMVREMGTDELRTIRLPDVQAPELGTVQGDEGRDLVANMLNPGDQLTIETAGGDRQDPYGREVSKVYWSDNAGTMVDVSTPFKVTDEETIKATDPLGAPSDVGTFSGVMAGLGKDVAELAMAPWDVADLVEHYIGDNSYDPFKESQAYRALSRFNDKMAKKQADWVSAGYDPDAKTYNIPGIGRLSIDEMAKAGLTSTVYAVGVLPLAGNLYKTAKATRNVTRAMKVFSGAEVAAQNIATQSAMVQRMRQNLGHLIAKGEVGMKKMDEALAMRSKILNDNKTFMHTPISDTAPTGTAIQRMKQYKDMFLSAWSDKYHPILALAKYAGKDDEMRLLLNQVKAAADVSDSPLTRGPILWEKMPDGHLVPGKQSESWLEIWQGVPEDELNNVMGWMVHDRVMEIHNLQSRLVKTHGSKRAAREFAEQNGMRWVNLTAKEVAEHAEMGQRIKQYYKSMPLVDDAGMEVGNQWDGLRKLTDAGERTVGGISELVDRTRAFTIKATLDVAMDVGWINKKQYDRILELNQHHAPFNRSNLGYLEDVLGPEQVKDILMLEDATLTQSGQVAALVGRGLTEKSVTKTPMARLGKHGVRPGTIDDIIVDPALTWMNRIPAINKAANQQRVRNLMGEMLDELGAGTKLSEDASFAQKWVHDTINVVDDTTAEGKKIVESVQKSPHTNAFIRYTKGKGDKVIRKAYITQDPALVEALGSLDPSQVSLFKMMMTHPLGKLLTKPTQLFRAGTVLGLHFMARNPMRDQFMAATLTKYGYTPVVDWWRGLYHVVTKSPLYEQMHALGGTQSTFTAANFERMQDSISNIETGEGLTKFLRRILSSGSRNADAVAAEAKNAGFLGRKNNLAKAVGSSWKQTKIKAGAKGNLLDPVRMSGYGLRRVSEIFEEATRTGAAARAVRRAKKGKKYTLTRSLDEAMGGSAGFFKMFYDPKHRAGFGQRWKAARSYSPEQMARMQSRGQFMDADVIDEIRNITLDFQTRGRYGEVINGLYPFFNAELQDYARFSRALAEAPISTMARGFAFVSMPAIANWYINHDNPKYHELPDVEKELFLHPWGYNPEHKKFGRQSRPIGTVSGVFGLVPHKMLDYWAANDPAMIAALEETLWPGASAMEARNMFLETMSEATGKYEEEVPEWARQLMHGAAMGNLPMHQTGAVGERVANGDPKYRDVPAGQYASDHFSDYVSTNTAARYIYPRRKDLVGRVTSIAPQAVAPFAQAAMNYDPFYDRSIISPSIANSGRKPQDQYDELSSPLDRALAMGLNTMLHTELTPGQASYLIRRYTGSVGSMVWNNARVLAEKGGVIDAPPGVAKGPTDKFTEKAFYSREPFGSNSDSVRELYKTWKLDSQAIESMEWALDMGDGQRYMDIVGDHPEVFPAAMLQEAVADLGEFYDLRDQVRVAPGLEDEQRADLLLQIDQSITMYAQNIMQAYWSIKRDPSMSFDLFGR